MVDSASVSLSSFRQQFAAKAVVPEREIKSAESFIGSLESLIAKGAAPSAQEIEKGTHLLKDLDTKAEIFMFSAAVLAGQEEPTEGALDRRVADISKGLERVEQTSARLRQTLEAFA